MTISHIVMYLRGIIEIVYFTYRGNNGSSEEERTAEVPVAGVIGRVSNGTHSSTDRIHCMLGKDAHTDKDSDSHFGSASLTVSD